MQKYCIVNEQADMVICKIKGYRYGLHYRTHKDCVDDGFEVVKTTKNKAERERDYLNQGCQKGWEVKPV